MPVITVNTQTAQNLTISSRQLVDICAWLGTLGSPILIANTDVLGGEIYNVMSTFIGDDVMNPTYGSNLPKRLFEPITPNIEQLCIHDVFFAAQNWVPQVKVNIAQTVVFANTGNRLVGVGVAYAYSGGNWLQNVSLTSSLSTGFSGLGG